MIPSLMKRVRVLLARAMLAVCAAGVLSVPAAAQNAADNLPPRAEMAARAATGDARLATLGDLRHLENSLRAELREIRETIQWLIIALIAVLGLPQLTAMWERRRGGGNGNGGGGGRGMSSAVGAALAAFPWLLGFFAVVVAVAG